MAVGTGIGRGRIRRWFTRISTALGFAAAAVPLGLRAQPAPPAVDDGLRIAAVVENEPITVRDLEARIRLVALTSSLPDAPETRRRLLPQVLRSYIDELLQLQEAARYGIRVSEEEVDQALATVAARNRMTPRQLVGLLEKNGIPVRTLREQLRAQIAWARFVRRVLEPRVRVTREQLARELERLADRAGEEVRLGEILLPVDSPREEPRVLEQARELVRALRSGADFRALATQVSAAPSARDGGEVGWVRVRDLAPALQKIVASLAPGRVSKPVRTPEGYRIFTVFERRAATDDPAADVVEIAQIVFPLRPDAEPREVERALRRAKAVLPRLTSCGAVQAVATELRAPASGRLGWMRLSDLPPAFREVVAGLRPGEASGPLRGPLGIHVLYLCARGGEEGLRALARLEIVRREVARLAARYLRDLRRSAYIDIRIGA